MTNLTALENGLFSNLQSEFNKFINVLDTTPNKCNEQSLKKIILLNEQMRILENMIYELKIDIYSNRISSTADKDLAELDEHEKNQQVIDKFKPFMLYYRLMMD